MNLGGLYVFIIVMICFCRLVVMLSLGIPGKLECKRDLLNVSNIEMKEVNVYEIQEQPRLKLKHD